MQKNAYLKEVMDRNKYRMPKPGVTTPEEDLRNFCEFLDDELRPVAKEARRLAALSQLEAAKIIIVD